MAELKVKDITKQRIYPIFVDKLCKLEGQTNIFKLKSGAKTAGWRGSQRQSVGELIDTAQFVATGLVINDKEYTDLNSERQANNIKKILGKPGAQNTIKNIELIGKPKGSRMKDNLYVLINQFDKSGTPEFAASGSGGGATKTEMQEGGACIALAWLLDPISKGKALDFSDFDTPVKRKKLLQTLDQRVDLGPFETKDGMNKILDFFYDEPDWLKVSTDTAKKLKSEVSKRNAGADLHMHRDSVFMREIYKRARVEIKQSPALANVLKDLSTSDDAYKLKIGVDKWNPGDIWLADGHGNEGFPATKDSSLFTLNKQVLEKFNKAKIMGISLKKVGDTINFKLYNTEQTNERFEGFVFTAIKKENSDKLMNSKDMYIEGKYGKSDQLLQIRTFDADSNIQTELKGGAAAAGKAGFGVVEFTMKTFKQEKLLTYPTINALDKDKAWDDQTQKMKLIKDYYSQLGFGSISDKQILASLEKKKNNNSVKFPDWAKRNQDDYWTSKIEAMQICNIIYQASKKGTDTANNMMTVIMAYAMSLGLVRPSKDGLEEVFRASAFGKVY